MLETVKGGLESKEGKAVLYAGLIGLIISDIIPTPADAVAFTIERKLRDRWKKGEITPSEYWRKKTAAYYLLNPIWWSIVAAVTLSIKGDSSKKIKTLGWMVGGGVVAAVIFKNIQKDKKDLADELLEKETFIKENPQYAALFKATNGFKEFKNVTGELIKKQNV